MINLSILIPCHNWNLLKLVNDLNQLCIKSKSLNNFEIICIEDGSKKLFKNFKIEQIENAHYSILNKNIGRSAVRNKLARSANFEWLLFIDCDSEIVDDNFIENYLIEANKNKNKTVFYGQTLYKTSNNCEFSLHENYGKKIESKKKIKHFSSHHFLIKKNLLLKKEFNEKITKYGYEDLIFQLESNYNFEYIDNPLYHIGLKKNSKFIADCEASLENLLIYENQKIIENKIRVLVWFNKLNVFQSFILIAFKFLKPHILKNLNSNKPNLILLQFYKLGFLFTIKKKFFQKA